MAELADALDLGSSGVTRTGSIPASRTKIIEIIPYLHTLCNGDFLIKMLQL